MVNHPMRIESACCVLTVNRKGWGIIRHDVEPWGLRFSCNYANLLMAVGLESEGQGLTLGPPLLPHSG